MVVLFPSGFEEREGDDLLELAAYGDSASAEQLSRVLGPVSSEPIEPGWEERWKEFHRSVRLGRLWVGPPWERPDDDFVPVVIDPGRAFGTGAHPTTRLSLELLYSLEPAGLLDVGCGSGVVAIAAARLGFGPVEAVDVDAAAVEATDRNARVNGVAVAVRVTDALVEPLPSVDVVVANIALAAVERLAPLLRCDRFVSAGYLERDQPALASFVHEGRLSHDGWAADVWSQPSRG
jgi:ribosomal protein L11 methyltransferase